MKRRMLWVFLVGILIGIALSGLYQHFVTDRIMDRGGMENPDYAWSELGVTSTPMVPFQKTQE